MVFAELREMTMCVKVASVLLYRSSSRKIVENSPK